MAQYTWKSGYRYDVDPQAAGEQLAELNDRLGGELTPRAVVEDSQSPDKPLHPAFEWNDSKAADLYRDEQARHIIRSVRVIHSPRDTPSIAYVRVHSERGSAYVTTVRAMSDDTMRKQVLAEALRALEAWEARYRHLEELAMVHAAIASTKADLDPVGV